MIGIDNNYSYVFLSSLNKEPLFHSNFQIEEKNKTITFTKLEFSSSDEPLENEPNSTEADYFNKSVLSEFVEAKKLETYSYK